jgi:hypothetical protein
VRRADEARPRSEPEAREEVDRSQVEGGDQAEGWTTMSELPSGSRSQNIGGTGPP